MKAKNIPSEIKNGIIHSKRRKEYYKECRLRSRSGSGFACSHCYLGLVQITLRKLNPGKWNRVDCSELYAMIFGEEAPRHHDCIDRNNTMMQIFELIGKRSCKI